VVKARAAWSYVGGPPQSAVPTHPRRNKPKKSDPEQTPKKRVHANPRKPKSTGRSACATQAGLKIGHYTGEARTHDLGEMGPAVLDPYLHKPKRRGKHAPAEARRAQGSLRRWGTWLRGGTSRDKVRRYQSFMARQAGGRVFLAADAIGEPEWRHHFSAVKASISFCLTPKMPKFD